MTKTLEELKKEIELIQSESNNKIQELIKQYEVEKEQKEEFKIVKRSNEGDYYYCIYSISNDKNESTISFQNEEKRKQFRELISDEEIIEFLSF